MKHHLRLDMPCHAQHARLFKSINGECHTHFCHSKHSFIHIFQHTSFLNMAFTSSPTIKQFAKSLIKLDDAFIKDEAKVERAAKRSAHGLRPCYKVTVCHGGDIKVKEGDKPWHVITPKMIKEQRPLWYGACQQFSDSNGASISSLLSTIYQPPHLPNNEKRKGVYRRLAYYAGYKEREPLPDYLLEIVRCIFPSEDGKYLGFKAY